MSSSPLGHRWIASGLLSVLILTSASCEKPAPPAPPPPMPVSVVNPLRREVTNYLYFNGTTRGIKQTEVRPRVPGYLEKINFKADTQVKEGEPLVIIDQKPYKVAVQRAQAVLLGKQATVASAKANLDRLRALVTQQAASEQELIDKQAAHDLAVAEAGVAEAELVDAQNNLQYTEVRAPISGRISKNMVDEGTLVRVDEPVLATIVNDNQIYVDFQVSEAEFLDYLRTHPRSRMDDAHEQPPTLLDMGMSDEPGFPHHGEVVSGDNTVDPGTGTYGVRGLFENPNKQIAPGLYVRIRAQMGAGKAMLVPDVAVQADPRGQFVFVVNDKNVVERRAVTPGPLAGTNYRRIISGLETTDQVIVNGLMFVRPEAVVSPQFVEPPPLPTTVPTTNPASQPATNPTTQAAAGEGH